MEKGNISDMISKVMSSNQPKTIQRVVPIKHQDNKEVQFSFYLSKNLLKQMKQRALDDNESIKCIINRALESYLNT
ncbi:MAG: hypothetical protein ACTIJ9_03420 [Aequorivita sp.]